MNSSVQVRAASPSRDVPTLRMNRGHPMAEGLSPSTQTPLPIIRLCGDYELTRVLGRGGMGVVYLARQNGLKRNVAYKALTHLGSADPETLERFRAEAETLGKLQHSGIVQIFDCGTENGNPYLVMEYVCGGSLAETLKNGRLLPHDAAALVATMATAVGHAHSHGVIHRDLKPANILLTADGQPKVADFGLARDLAREHLTQTGMIAGTPTYMPPEQLTGRKDLTPAVDVWALGVLLYEMLSGTVPFGGDNPQQILTNILQHEPVSLRAWHPNLPRDLETICRKCLHKDPGRRYPSGKALADDLARFLEGKPILARPIGLWEKRWNWCRKNPLAAGLTFGLALTLSGATAVSLTFAGAANRERANAIAAAERADDLREKAESALAAAKKSAAAEKAAREDAEKAVAAERAAREGAEALATITEGLLKKMGPANDLRQELVAQMGLMADRLLAGACDPLVRARLLLQLAETRQGLGDWKNGIPLAEMALALRTERLGPDHPDTRETAMKLGYLYCHLDNRGEDAVRLIKPVIEAEIAALPADSPKIVGLLGTLNIAYYAAGRVDEHARLAERILTIVEKLYGPDHTETEWRRVTLPKYSLAARNFDEAIPVMKKAYKTFERDRGKESMEYIWLRRHLGAMLCAAGRHREAINYLRPAYESCLHSCGPNHPHVLADRWKLAGAYEACQMYTEELPLRWAMLHDEYAQKSLRYTGEQLLKFGRDLLWKWRAALTSPPA